MTNLLTEQPTLTNSSLLTTNQADSELIRLWLGTRTGTRTKKEYARDITRFISSLPSGTTIRTVTAQHVLRFKEQLENGTIKENTVKRYLSVVKSLLSFAHQTGYVPFNVGAVFKSKGGSNERAQRCLSEVEVFQLVTSAKSTRDKLLLRLLYTTGIRVSELAVLKWNNLQERSTGGQVTVLGKGEKTRAVLIPASLWNDLMNFKGGTQEEQPVFKSRQRSGDGSYELSIQQVNRIVKAAAKLAGMGTRVSPHWFRHSHASHSLERGASIALVSSTLGHANIATTSAYIHARPNESSSSYLLAV